MMKHLIQSFKDFIGAMHPPTNVTKGHMLQIYLIGAQEAVIAIKHNANLNPEQFDLCNQMIKDLTEEMRNLNIQ